VSALVDELVSFGGIDLLDVDGRPIGELASRRYDPDATRVIACPFAGSRHGLPMNATALAQVHTVWPAIVTSTRALAGPDATVGRAFSVAMLGVTAPLAHAAAHPGEPVPRLLSTLFKTSLGFSQLLATLLLADDGVADARLADLGDEAAFIAFLEDGRWLIGQGHVCAGPAPRIAELFSALCGRDGPCEVAPQLAAVGPVPLATQSVAVVGAQIAHQIGQRLRGVSEAAPRAPWLRAVWSVPSRRPMHAARLFATGAVPEAVRAVIDAADDPTADVGAAFADALEALS
jgi:hypothetical protein